MTIAYRALRPFLFMVPPERMHRLTVEGLKRVGRFLPDPSPDDPILAQTVLGMSLRNPFGPAAGFDKNGELIEAASRMGFGFTEIGTVTPDPQPGNPPPRLFRLVAREALVNGLGFNNRGQEEALGRVRDVRARRRGRRTDPIGVNLGVGAACVDRVRDYGIGAARFADAADYLVVNVSSPNTPGLRSLQEVSEIEDVMAEVRERAPDTPTFVKIAPDLATDRALEVARAAVAHRISGLVVANTLPVGPSIRNGPTGGGLSGRPLFERSTALLGELFSAFGRTLVFIGVGGVATPEEAYAKIRAGASLVQVYTAMVYRGPCLVDTLKRGLVDLLTADGHATIESAVGSGSP